jgi:hypothetical protein
MALQFPASVVAAFEQVQKNFEFLSGLFPLGADEIEDGSIGTAELADGAITGPKMGLDNTYAVASSADLTVTATTIGARQDVTGATLTLATAGLYKVTASIDANKTAHAGAELLIVLLDVGGVSQNASAQFQASAAGNRVSISQQWKITVAAGTVVKLTAFKSVATGTYIIESGGTTLLAEQLSD